MKQTLYPIALLFALLPGVTLLAQEPEGRRFGKAVLIRFEGVVSPRTEQFLYRKLDQARESGADLVIIEIDSPGGYLESSLDIATKLRDLDWVHTVAWVPDEALSGAAIFALGCDDIVMQPRARIGDAGPIFQGQDALFRHAPEKIRSDLARRVRDLAEAKARPPALAEAMVDMDLEVFRVTNKDTGEETFKSDSELVSDRNVQAWEKGELVLESQKGRFLEINGERAVELKMAKATAENREQLVELYQVREPLIVMQPGGVDTAVYVLNLPIVTGLLFVVGLVALYVEFSAPGISVGGLLAGLCFTLFFWSRFLGGTAGWLEVILFLGGLVFLGIELFVFPGFGVAGITGLLMLLAGVVLASQSHLFPESPRALAQLGNSLIVVLASGGVFVGAVIMLSRYYGSIPLFNRLILEVPQVTDVTEDVDQEGKPLPPSQAFPVGVGDWGVAESPLRPAGKAMFGEQFVDVVTDGSFVDAGSQVQIIQISGNRIVVREIEDKV